jgi:hypothetical protein
MLARLAGVAACAVALTLTSSAVAQAATTTLVDPRGDVWAQDTPSIGQNTKAPDRRQGDIVRTDLQHNRSQVVIRTRFAELDRVGHDFVSVAWLRTNTGRVRVALLHASPRPGTNRWRGTLTLRDRADTRSFKCATSHHIDYTANVAVMRIPRSCLGDPRTVQGAFASGTAGGGTFFVDNPSNQGPSARRPPYTAPVRVG